MDVFLSQQLYNESVRSSTPKVGHQKSYSHIFSYRNIRLQKLILFIYINISIFHFSSCKAPQNIIPVRSSPNFLSWHYKPFTIWLQLMRRKLSTPKWQLKLPIPMRLPSKLSSLKFLVTCDCLFLMLNNLNFKSSLRICSSSTFSLMPK